MSVKTVKNIVVDIPDTEQVMRDKAKKLRSEALDLRDIAANALKKSQILDLEILALESKLPRKELDLEVRNNTNGKLDEIVCEGAYVHLEQMSKYHWWMVITKGDKTITVNFNSKDRISAVAEES